MVPRVCAECGKPGDLQKRVLAVAGVYAHKACRVVWSKCKVQRCSEQAKGDGLCMPHYNRKYYAERVDYMRERAKRWYRENPEKVAERYERQKAAGYHRAKAREWYWRNRLQAVAIQQNHRAVRMGFPTPVTFDQFRGRLEMFGGRCYMCGADADTFDHVKPYAAGGPHLASNLRPACRSCNSKKHKIWKGVGPWLVAC